MAGSRLGAMSLVDRFWSKVDRRGPDECWEWTRARNELGYGRFRFRGCLYYAHRMAWELVNGPVPEALEVCHTCDNPPCCNPAHLFVGTHADNLGDMATKGRAKPVPILGEQNGNSRLTSEEVEAIRRRYVRGVTRQVDLAREYGISQPTISCVIRATTWPKATAARTR